MSLTEDRFRQGSGQKFLLNGEVRCQAVSKSQVYKWREEHDDWKTPTEMLWPECQCTKRAEPGRFTCYWHGGTANRSKDIKTIYDVMPIDLAEKVKIALSDPAYISRKENMAIIKARQMQILEQLQTLDSEEAWGVVADALFELQKGHNAEAVSMLKDALSYPNDGKDLWEEYYKAERIMNAATATEVKTAKELQLMATAEQVGRLVSRVYEILMTGAEKYIHDNNAQSAFLRYVSKELAGAVNLSPTTIVGILEAGSGSSDGDSEYLDF